MNERYDRLLASSREISTLESIGELLSWDQETYMPPAATDARSEQRTLVATLMHQRLVSEQLGEAIERLHGSEELEALGAEAVANVRELRRRHQRERKVPADLVQQIARTTALAHQPWVQARKENKLQLFAPWLERLVNLKKQWAEAVGYDAEPYDALLDEYEPEMRSQELHPLFDQLRSVLIELLGRIQASPLKPTESLFRGLFDLDKQREFGVKVASELGFNFHRGRLDTSAHPFCTGLAETDVRLTTRYDAADPTKSLLGIIHEAGHGMYEQGLLEEHRGTPMGSAVSLGVHESQSRWWENFIGRSRPFWEHYLPELQACFPAMLDAVALPEFLLAINQVRPSLIRVEADEVTYNLHILIRVELERELFSDALRVAELPDAWNERMDHYLGIRPSNDSDGVLQDIHWSMGGFGYFPTYTLGNLYAGQLDHQLRQDIPDVQRRISHGQFGELREWMGSRIHRHGSLYPPAELIREVTGLEPDSRFFLDYLNRKYTELYEL